MLQMGYASVVDVTHRAMFLGSFRGGRGRDSRLGAKILTFVLQLGSNEVEASPGQLMQQSGSWEHCIPPGQALHEWSLV